MTDCIKNIIDGSIRTSRIHINRIIEVVAMIENSKKYQDDEFIKSLVSSSCKLLSHNMNMSYLYDDALLDKPHNAINIKEVIKAIVDECAQMLKPVGRELQLVSNSEKNFLHINEKVFTLMFMNLLQNALLYSPSKSAVIIIINSDCIEITNLMGEQHREYQSPLNHEDDENLGTGVPLCKKIAEHYGGSLEYIVNEGKLTAKLIFNFEAENRANIVTLSAELNEYISEKFKPAKLFMYEVLDKER
jgi:K+-sensing histidine kinase KdpD